MTVTDKPRFMQAFNRLAVALREDPDAVKLQVYFDALSGYPIEAVEASAERLSRVAEWFPKTSEWVALAQIHVADGFKKQLYAARQEPWHYECEACEDTGWIRYMRAISLSPWKHRPIALADLEREISWCERCSCIDTNRTYQRERAMRLGVKQS